MVSSYQYSPADSDHASISKIISFNHGLLPMSWALPLSIHSRDLKKRAALEGCPCRNARNSLALVRDSSRRAVELRNFDCQRLVVAGSAVLQNAESDSLAKNK